MGHVYLQFPYFYQTKLNEQTAFSIRSLRDYTPSECTTAEVYTKSQIAKLLFEQMSKVYKEQYFMWI